VHSKTSRRLVWIVAGGLAFFGYTVGTGTHILRKSTWTQAALKDLTYGIKNYRFEYNRYPVPPMTDNPGIDQRFETTGKLLACLLGKNVDGLNPREIEYIEPPMAREGHRGLIKGRTPADDKLMDIWGHPYVVVLDLNGDNRIANPDVKNTSPLISKGAPQVLNVGVLAYSLGPDGIEGTHDDIVSWRDIIPTRGEQFWKLARMAMVVATPVVIAIGFAQMLLLIKDAVMRVTARRDPE